MCCRSSTAAARSRGRLTATLVVTAAFLLVEVAGALWSGSLALLADAGHMLTDVGGLALALFAIRIAARPPTPEKTYGYYRAEILAALRRRAFADFHDQTIVDDDVAVRDHGIGQDDAGIFKDHGAGV